MTDRTSLLGKLLIAMPDMGDPRFDHSVIYICAHSAEGAMGLIINKPTPEVRFGDLLEQLSIDEGELAVDVRIHYGGPVEMGRGFVLHTSDYASGAGTMDVSNGIAMTATLDILEDIAVGNGPKRSMLGLGYAGWGPHQLEDELINNGWLVTDANEDILFGRAAEHKWTAALKTLGIDPLMLSASGGSA
ncbi:YqgE/AlgH family protein [Octadecabacter sp. 1_MG-2023]|uniref:YqgE/AlgH family protein n=1 Tax=unclassified Octadecabacter TaxID=196158 RepID=UPI001C08DE84|nr:MULTISPECIES: YqgE/AlgH family protein [unclassified Octadecabacter]MBU2994162.1 YqgE/AlgH family protein [Octadecabacter sp. B2R22]MDO6734549.1 YqgE/AlgH family protein [Octadecabacter sp. 1_MG-2023]